MGPRARTAAGIALLAAAGAALLLFEARFGFNEVAVEYRDLGGRRTLDVNSFQHEHPEDGSGVVLVALGTAAATGGFWFLSPAPARGWAAVHAATLAGLWLAFGLVATVQDIAPTAAGAAGSVWVGPHLALAAHRGWAGPALFAALWTAHALSLAGLVRPGAVGALLRPGGGSEAPGEEAP